MRAFLWRESVAAVGQVGDPPKNDAIGTVDAGLPVPTKLIARHRESRRAEPVINPAPHTTLTWELAPTPILPGENHGASDPHELERPKPLIPLRRAGPASQAANSGRAPHLVGFLKAEREEGDPAGVTGPVREVWSERIGVSLGDRAEAERIAATHGNGFPRGGE